MTLQLDIIPATGMACHTTNIEDGVARAELAARYPDLWQRVGRRRVHGGHARDPPCLITPLG